MDVQKTIEFILEQQAFITARQAKTEEEHAAKLAAIDRRLDRAVRLGIREARHERRRRAEFDEKITQLAAAQLVTEERMKDLAVAQQETEVAMKNLAGAQRETEESLKESMKALAAAQRVTEEKLQRLIDLRGGNGSR
jgi:hypothetical protein